MTMYDTLHRYDDPEVWVDIEGFEGHYQISNRGRVRSLTRSSADGRRLKGQLIRHAPKDGRPMVNLRKDNRSNPRRVHQLVAHHFLGPQPPDTYIYHRDRDTTNNHAANLRYMDGLTSKGGLSEREVYLLTMLLATDCFTDEDLAAIVGLHPISIESLRNGRTYTALVDEVATHPAFRYKLNNVRAVIAIKRLLSHLASGKPFNQRVIAYAFDIDQGLISKIKHGHRWGHIRE
jgi:hypothetical protein